MRRELEIGLLVGVEVRIDRIVGDDSGQHVGVRNQIAGGDQRARNAAVDRRAHLGELEVESRRFQCRRGGTDIVGAGAGGRGELIEILLRDHVLRDQALAAVMVRRGELGLRTRATQLRAEPVHFGLERTRIDAEQQLAFLDARAFAELNGIDETADSRPDFDAFDGLQSAAEFLPVAKRLGDHAGNGDFGCGRRCGFAARLRAGATGECRGQRDGCEERTAEGGSDDEHGRAPLRSRQRVDLARTGPI